VLCGSLVAALMAVGARPVLAQASATPPANLKPLIANLSSLEFPTRMNAARQLRRAPAAEVVPALADAVRHHPDEYVRNRAFILLTAFNDRGTPALVPDLLKDRNDRLRASAYKWLEQHPDPRLAPVLLAALQTEVAEFVRPALIDALAAVDQEPAVQRALVGEVGRGLDLFRSAVIDTLGRHHAGYAADAIAPVTANDGPLQVDAVLAIGRIGGAKADAVLAAVKSTAPEVQHAVRAATCLAGRDCEAAIAALSAGATSASARPVAVRAAINGLGAIAEAGNATALRALLDLATRLPALHEDVAIAFSTLAVRRPAAVLEWLDSAPEASRPAAIALLKDGFDTLEEDFGEEQFYAATRAMYWQAAEDSPTRALMSTLLQRLEF